SPLATPDFVPKPPEAAGILECHFDNQLGPELFAAYVDLVRATSAWLLENPRLAELVRVEQPMELGTDFVARPHHTYYTSTDAYTRAEDPPRPPAELAEMRSLLRAVFGEPPADAREAIVRRVLARSLLEPSGKTYYAG